VLVTFLSYAQQLSGPAQELANAITMIQSAGASAERVQGLLDEPETIRDSNQVLERIRAHAADVTSHNRSTSDPRSTSGPESTSTPISGSASDGLDARIRTIEFRHVNFGYTPESLVLRDFSLTVEAGQTIALVGATGGGKSTIVSLLCRFYEPTSGEILLDGVDYRQRPLLWLQGSLGMVLQQPHLFSGTIRENIRYGRLAATDDEVIHAAKLTNAHAFIEKLADGYSSPAEHDPKCRSDPGHRSGFDRRTGHPSRADPSQGSIPRPLHRSVRPRTRGSPDARGVAARSLKLCQTLD
jgi:ATP-binding cassette subfamily B protein